MHSCIFWTEANYEVVLGEILQNASKSGGQISLSEIWNAAIEAAIDLVEYKARARTNHASDSTCNHDSEEVERLLRQAQIFQETASQLLDLMAPNTTDDRR